MFDENQKCNPLICFSEKKYNNDFNDYHLNWFGKAEDEGRTELPSQRKISKAREQGDVPRSMELDSAIMLLVCFSAIYYLSPYIYNACLDFTRVFLLNEFNIRNLTENELNSLMQYSFIFIAKVSGPVMVIALVITITTNLIQVGFMFTPSKLKFDMSKISFNPQKAFQKMLISKDVMFNFAKSLVKLVIIGLVSYTVLKSELTHFLSLAQCEPYESVLFICHISIEIILKSALLLIIFALVDYMYVKHQFIDKLKMTKQEVKDEYKQMEGDPQIKSKIREKQIQAARRRMMEEVPKADVIIRNPTHYAVALRYDVKEMRAPTVVAKGAGFIALKIIELGEDSSVPIVTNKPLAKTLYAQVEIGDEVPVELYKTVAEVLAYVWKLKGKKM